MNNQPTHRLRGTPLILTINGGSSPRRLPAGLLPGKHPAPQWLTMDAASVYWAGASSPPGTGPAMRPTWSWPAGTTCPRSVLSWRARLSSRPCAHPDTDVFETVRGGTSDDFPDAHPRAVLVHPPCTDSVGSGTRHANRGDSDCGLWAIYDTHRLGLGPVHLGLCAGLVHCE